LEVVETVALEDLQGDVAMNSDLNLAIVNVFYISPRSKSKGELPWIDSTVSRETSRLQHNKLNISSHDFAVLWPCRDRKWRFLSWVAIGWMNDQLAFGRSTRSKSS
jgi:hypothetical protein